MLQPHSRSQLFAANSCTSKRARYCCVLKRLGRQASRRRCRRGGPRSGQKGICYSNLSKNQTTLSANGIQILEHTRRLPVTLFSKDYSDSRRTCDL